MKTYTFKERKQWNSEERVKHYAEMREELRVGDKVRIVLLEGPYHPLVIGNIGVVNGFSKETLQVQFKNTRFSSYGATLYPHEVEPIENKIQTLQQHLEGLVAE